MVRPASIRFRVLECQVSLRTAFFSSEIMFFIENDFACFSITGVCYPVEYHVVLVLKLVFPGSPLLFRILTEGEVPLTLSSVSFGSDFFFSVSSEVIPVRLHIRIRNNSTCRRGFLLVLKEMSQLLPSSRALKMKSSGQCCLSAADIFVL